MKIATVIARVLLGLVFVVFGSNIFLHFIPMPPPPATLVGDFTKALVESHYIYVVGILQVVAAYLLGPYALEKQGTYGALGLAAALLLGLWALGRLLIGGAEINATLWERKRREST